MADFTAGCACTRVRQDVLHHGDGTCSESWVCALGCGSLFTRQAHAERLAGVADSLRAQLAESKRRLQAILRSNESWDLRSIVARLLAGADHLLIDHACDSHGWEGLDHAKRAGAEWLAAFDALAADQTTARESAENTAEETMTEQSVEAVCVFCGKPIGPQEPGASLEDGGFAHQGCDKPAPAQPPEPVEPSDHSTAARMKLVRLGEHLDREVYGPIILNPSDGNEDQHYLGLEAVYHAGLAAERAERVEWLKSDAARVELNAVTENGELKVELERVRAELTKETKRADSCCGHAAYGDEKFRSLRDAFEASEEQLKDARAELERVRGQLALVDAAHVEATTERDTLRAQARARRVPTREALAELMYRVICARESPNAWKALHAKPREMYLETADAVLRLFAEADGSEPGCLG